MKKITLAVLAIFTSLILHAQSDYDSITISRFIERTPSYGAGWTKTTHRNYSADLVGEHSIWINDQKAKDTPYIFSLTERVRENGAKSVGRCFVPRHIINFYKAGAVSRYILICFECNGMEFSDMPIEHTALLVSKDVRLKQIDELKIVFKDLL